MSKFTDAIEKLQTGFFDRPARMPRTPTESEIAYWRAARTTSWSGDLCKLLGLIGVVIGAPSALIFGSAFSPIAGPALAVSILASSAGLAAIGSSASSNKKTAALLALQLWENGPAEP